MPTPGERSTSGSPGPLEAGLEALGEVAGCGLAHRAGDAERSAEQLLLGAQRAQPLVVGAGNVGAVLESFLVRLLDLGRPDLRGTLDLADHSPDPNVPQR